MMTSEDPQMTRHRAGPAARLLLAALAAAGLSACAPQYTGATYSPAALGRTAAVSYGTVVGTRPVVVQGSGGGVGTVLGAVGGGIAGSFIGGDWRSNALAGLGGAALGGLAGNAIERNASTGTATEFTVREDGYGDIQLVQTNEEGLQVGDRVVISRGERTRLSRAAGGPPPQAYAPQPGTVPGGYQGAYQGGYAPQAGYQPGYPQPGGYQPPGYAAQGGYQTGGYAAARPYEAPPAYVPQASYVPPGGYTPAPAYVPPAYPPAAY